ncbi:MAG: D-alanyl-D-alanine carboxypeptidase/D-alanyl-D-alanine-endopeptidase [Blastocatellia bacterium]|nr:D-alanyl-D-alanine carboxypeptidase/D-alanyl-D-alanine-endopeptidase [Blastocatellia bacterium]
MRRSIFLSVILAFCTAFLFGCGAAEHSSNAVPQQPIAVIDAIPAVDLTKPLVVSTQPDDVELARSIEAIISDSAIRNARWGVFVASLKDGRVLIDRDAQMLFTPASTMKLITSAAGLDMLGPDFRWSTKLQTTSPPAAGRVSGNLYLYGQGSPDLNTAGLERLVDQVRRQGITTIGGGIVADASHFRGDLLGQGWSWEDLQWYYGAPASPLSFNSNFVTLNVTEGEAAVSPRTAPVRVTSEVEYGSGPNTIGVKRELSSDNIRVWGQGPAMSVRVAMADPAMHAASSLQELLRGRGVAVGEPMSVRAWSPFAEREAGNRDDVAAIEGQSLAEAVRGLNKNSVNLTAELVLRTLGREFGRPPEGGNNRRASVRGDDAAGAAVIKRWLAEKGASLQENETIADGSGLSRLNLITPETLGRTLIYASQMPTAGIYRDSLPIAGMDGTLRGRLTSVRGRILAKTGSIYLVNSLAGYALREDETLVFAIIVNNEPRRGDVNALIDQIASLLVTN